MREAGSEEVSVMINILVLIYLFYPQSKYKVKFCSVTEKRVKSLNISVRERKQQI
jgi:hypothetical protein